MTVVITTIPDDPQEWSGWLEQHLVGLRLCELIEELRLLPDSSAKPLKELLTERELAAARQLGLSSLSVNQIRRLFSSPGSLLELQEEVLINGGDYWTSLPPSTDVQLATERVRTHLNETLSVGQRGALLQKKPKETHSGKTFVVWLASAAVVLLIGVTIWKMQPAGSGRILGQPGLLANNVQSSVEYLARIATAGNTWFDQHPRDSTELIALLQDVSNDCQILIDAEHKPLTTFERAWFVAKCQNWKGQFDATLDALRSGLLTFGTARAEADRTMMKLVNVLQAGPMA